MSFQENKNRLHNPIVRSIILAVLPIASGIVSATMGNWDPTEISGFYSKLCLFLIFTILDIAALVKYAQWDFEKDENTKALQKRYNDLEEQNALANRKNKILKQELGDLSSMMQNTAHNLNTIAHQIYTKGEIDLNTWSFRKSCKEICDISLALLRTIAVEGDDFSVSYIQKEDRGNDTFLEMPALSGTTDTPDIKELDKNIRDVSDYYYARLFLSPPSDIVVLPDENAIRKNFVFPKNGSAAQHKYNQYIAIPIVCNHKKMIGLLQIIAHHNSRIAFDEDTLHKIARDYFEPLGICAMLMNKIEKAATAVPTSKEE